MEKKYIFDYLISSASCFPVFPIHTFQGQSFIDGGYYDNVPIDLAFDMGADEVIVVDMSENATHKHYLNRPHVIYTTPYLDLGTFMDFTHESLERNQRIGYQTAMKYLGNYGGVKYTFKTFHTPLFNEFYKEILYLERNHRTVTRNDTVGNLNDKFLESHKNQLLDEKDYLYITLDWLAELMNRDASYVYDFDLFVNDLLDFYKKYTDKDYQMISLRSFEDVVHTLKNIGKVGIVGRLLHGMLYPEEGNIDVGKLMTVFPKELVMAKLLFMLYNEKRLR